ncbi:CBU_0592 family membrane protein [Schumannella luteola]
MDVVFEVVGWVGTVLLIGAYFLLSVGRIPNGRTYQLFNLFGAIGLLINGAVHGAWPSVILNVVWSGIGVFALIQLARKRRVNTAETPSADSATI